MPIFLQQGDVVKAAIVCATVDQVGLFTSHFLIGLPSGTGPSLQDLAALLDTNCGPLIKVIMSNAARYARVEVQRVYPTPKSLVVVDATNAGAGSSGADLMSTQTSGLVTKQSAYAGRANRGRCYVPFPSESMNDANGLPTSSYVTNLSALMNQFLISMTVSGGGESVNITPVITRAGSPVVNVPIITFRSNKKWATQRRRGSYGRPNLNV